MTGVEKLFFYWRVGIISDRGGNFSKLKLKKNKLIYNL